MSDILLDNEGDILISNGKISLKNSVAQKVSIALKTFQGSWFLDKNVGVPYFQSIFGKRIPQTKIDSILKDEIQKVGGVKQIISFKSELVDQKYSFTVKIISNENEEHEVVTKI